MSTEGICFNKNTNKSASTHLNCSVCGKNVPPVGVASVKVDHRDLVKCVLYELFNTIDFVLCHDCNLPLIRCRIGLDYVTVVRKYGQDITGCFMCRTKYKLAPFHISTNKIEVLVLRRLEIKYNFVTTGSKNVCQICDKLFKYVVNLHILYHDYITKIVNVHRCVSSDKLQLQHVNKESTSENDLTLSTCASTSSLNNNCSSRCDYSECMSTSCEHSQLKLLNSDSSQATNISCDQASTSDSKITDLTSESIVPFSTRKCSCCGFVETYDLEIDANDAELQELEIINTTQNLQNRSENTCEKINDEDSNLEETFACPSQYFPQPSWKTDGSDSITMIKKNSNEILLFNPRTVNLKVLKDTHEDVFTHLLTVINDIFRNGCDSMHDNVISKFDNFKTENVDQSVSLTVLDKMVDDWEMIMNTVLTNIIAVFDKDLKIPILKCFSERCPRHVNLAKLKFLHVIINFLDKLPAIFREIFFTRLYIKKGAI